MKNPRYQINRFLKLSTQDDFEQGEIGKTQMAEVDVKLSADSIEEVIAKAQEFIGTNEESTDRNAADEDGRIDFQVMECADGTAPSKAEIASWKKGRRKLWACTYTCRLEKIEIVRA